MTERLQMGMIQSIEKKRKKGQGEEYAGKLSKAAFYLALLIELTIVILDKSSYIIQYEGQWFRLTFALCCLSVITARHSRRTWLWLAAFGILGFLSYRATGRNEILRFVAFIWACKGRDMKKALKFTFWYTLAGCLLLVLLSVTGLYGDVALTAVYRAEIAWWAPGEAETRYCFGMGHPNAFHCMVLALTLLGLYCYDQKMKWYGYGLLFLLHTAVFLLTDSRSGFLASLGALGLVVLLHYGKPLREWKGSWILGMGALAFAVGFSVFMAKYSIFHPLLEKLDGWMSGRILNLYYDSEVHAGMLSTWSLWSVPENEYFFDLGIVRVFYWFGIIPGAVWFLAQCRLLWCGYRKKDYMLLAVVTAITVYSLFEAHYVSDYLGRNYLFFFMGMYLTDMLGGREGDGWNAGKAVD